MSHATKSGVATFVAPDEKACLDEVRHLLSFLPSNNLEEPPVEPTGDEPDRSVTELIDFLPTSPNQPYDMKRVITAVVDDGEYLEVHRHWAMSITCGFARMNGRVVGIVGNQPAVLAGVLDIDSSEKASRFVRTCDAFNVPLLTFVDVPGFMPGTDQEYGGIIRHGAKLLYAYCEATVPRIQIITRKAYGGAYVVMNSKSIGADLAFAWPSAELAVMGPNGAVEIVYRRELAEAADPARRRAELIDEYTERYANPYIAAERGYIDDVISPADTRAVICRSLDILASKREELPSASTATCRCENGGPLSGGPLSGGPLSGGPLSGPLSPAVDPDRLALRPRPGPDPAVLAAIAAAVQLAWPRPAAADEHDPVHEAWRFSGRWWNEPVPLRRDRPGRAADRLRRRLAPAGDGARPQRPLVPPAGRRPRRAPRHGRRARDPAPGLPTAPALGRPQPLRRAREPPAPRH